MNIVARRHIGLGLCIYPISALGHSAAIYSTGHLSIVAVIRLHLCIAGWRTSSPWRDAIRAPSHRSASVARVRIGGVEGRRCVPLSLMTAPSATLLADRLPTDSCLISGQMATTASSPLQHHVKTIVITGRSYWSRELTETLWSTKTTGSQARPESSRLDVFMPRSHHGSQAGRFARFHAGADSTPHRPKSTRTQARSSLEHLAAGGAPRLLLTLGSGAHSRIQGIVNAFFRLWRVASIGFPDLLPIPSVDY